MPNVIAVVQDDRARRQVEQYLQELGMEDLRFATFNDNAEFQALYFRDKSKDPPPEEKPAEEKPAEGADGDGEGAELRLFSEINMVIFALDSIGEKSGPWIEKLKINMKRFKYWPEGGRPRLVMLKYEDDGVNKLDILNPLLDDLVYLPLDRLVFLQKLQILLGLPKKVTPRFLFNQEVKHQIEISKISRIDRLSDVGLAIRNPVPLRRGLPGHFYLTMPGEKTRLEVRGKVLKSEPHPEYPGEFLVYFTYFNLAKADLTLIRRILSKSPRYQSLINDDRNAFKHNKDSLFDDVSFSEIFSVVVLDADEISGKSVATALAKEMDRVTAVAESSLQMFQHRYFEAGGMESLVPPRAPDESMLFHSPLSLNVATADLKCLSVDPAPKDEDKFLGHPAVELFATPEKWLTLFDQKESAPILQESAGLATQGRTINRTLSMKDAGDVRFALNFKMYAGPDGQTTIVEITPASLKDIVDRMSAAKKEAKLHLCVVEAAFVPEDPATWIEGMRLRAGQVGLVENPEDLKFVVLSETEGKVNPNWLNNKDILGLFVKPVDMRGLLFLLSEYLPNHHTLYNFANLGWSEPNLSVHVSKDVELEALSEFGATLKTKAQLVPGTMVYLRRSIFDNAPNECLAARVYACEEHPNDKSYFQVFTTYFGINDAFLKFARTWIRENYAHQKSSGGGD
ncbi:MAG TPA: hypothetical protein PKC28_08895 [Bdellovibrionales bacterium]|nr:hypothetical protein [Bdellovibrionales bacterium]